MKNLSKLALSLYLFIFLISPVFVFAADTTLPNPDPTPGGGSETYKITIPTFLNNNIKDIPSLITTIITKIVIPVGGVIAVLMIMYAGFQFVTAQGNASKVTDAKNTLINASIGAAILLGAQLIADVVKTTVTNLQ